MHAWHIGCAWCIYLYALLWFLSPKNNTTHKAKIPWSYFQQIISLFRIKKNIPPPLKKILCILQILNLNLIVCLSSSINLGTSCNMYVMSRVYDICLINGSVSSYISYIVNSFQNYIVCNLKKTDYWKTLYESSTE